MQSLGALAARATEKAEGVRKILRCQAAFFGEALRREVVSIAVGGGLADLDQAFLGAALEIGIRQSQRDAELLRDLPLCDAFVLVHGVQNPEGDLGFICLARRRYAFSVAHIITFIV